MYSKISVEVLEIISNKRIAQNALKIKINFILVRLQRWLFIWRWSIINDNINAFKHSFSFHITSKFMLSVPWVFSTDYRVKSKSTKQEEMAGVHNFNAYFHRNNLETKEKEKKEAKIRKHVTACKPIPIV